MPCTSPKPGSQPVSVTAPKPAHCLVRSHSVPFASRVLEVLGYRTCNVSPLTTHADAARVTSTCAAARTHVFRFAQQVESHAGAGGVASADACPICCVMHSSAAARAAHEAGAKHARALHIEQQWESYVAASFI